MSTSTSLEMHFKWRQSWSDLESPAGDLETIASFRKAQELNRPFDYYFYLHFCDIVIPKYFKNREILHAGAGSLVF